MGYSSAISSHAFEGIGRIAGPKVVQAIQRADTEGKYDELLAFARDSSA